MNQTSGNLPRPVTGLRTVLFGTLLCASLSVAAGCRDSGASADLGPALDLTMVDLAQTPAKPVSIRDLNNLNGVKLQDRVKFSGVVVSPFLWTNANTKGGFCNFRLVLMYADGSPSTLKDGMVLTVGLKTNALATDMAKTAVCQDLGKTNAVVTAMDALKLGDLVEVEGRFETSGTNGTGTRQVDVFAGKVTSMGPALMMPTPIDADPATYASTSTGVPPQAFVDAQGVLVTFRTVKTNTRDTMYQDFYVNTGATGGTRISTNYLRVIDRAYMSPMDGTSLTSLTGCVIGDFGGYVWPAKKADIVP